MVLDAGSDEVPGTGCCWATPINARLIDSVPPEVKTMPDGVAPGVRPRLSARLHGLVRDGSSCDRGGIPDDSPKGRIARRTSAAPGRRA